MNPEAQFAAAREAIRVGRFADAEASLRALLGVAPGHPLVLSLLGVSLRGQGRFDEALEPARRSAQAAPSNPGVLVNLGVVLIDAGCHDEASEVLTRAVAVAPGVVEGRVALSRAMSLQGRLLDAVDLCRESLAMAPDHPKLTANLGAALLYAGEGAAAIDAYQRGTQRWPEDLTLAMGLAASLVYAGTDDAPRVAAAHRRVGTLIAQAEGTHERPAIGDPDPDRRLRVGIMCADFRAHASAFFLAPILENADRGRVEYVLYSTGGREDQVTPRFRAWASAFHQVANLDPPALCARVRGDRVDVLLDLSGYAEGHRQAAFQRRAAPLQGTYLAYASTTGLPAMDFRIVDSITDPPGEAEALSTERLVRIDPCLLAFSKGAGLPGGPAEHPPPGEGERDGPITFGSFRGLQLLTDKTLDLWTPVLKGVPGSRLLMRNHGLSGQREREHTMARFTSRGIDAARILLEGPTSGAAQTLREYARLDIVLDSFPYSGTTTTCESLLMGVPIVTLMGATSASRVSGSIQQHAGVGELVARTPEQFVSITAGLAGDRERLATLRRDLPGRFERTVGDGAAFARRFEAAIREQWAEGCRTQGRG
ncbi:MAG: tetratricopeptide repeat protein [Phycisphaerales bacterium]|nr:tetratricopeptide repeat protein [Phycisphaerales bacterium]